MGVANSIIITVFNRPLRVFRNTLHALRQNDLNNCEVLIVDDGSTLDYSQIRQYLNQYEVPYRWVRIEASEYPDWTYTIPHPDGGVINNPALAMNRAIAESTGKRLMFLSSDCMIPNFAIKEAKNCGNSYWLASVVDQATNNMFVCDKRPKPYHFFSSCKKELVEAIGGFDENYLRGIAWEDNDFGARLGLYCKHVMFDSNVLVVHQSHDDLAYSDNMKGWRINENYTREKWNGLPYGNDKFVDPIDQNIQVGARVASSSPKLREGFKDPLDGRRSSLSPQLPGGPS